MSKDWVADIDAMHDKMGQTEAFAKFDKKKKELFLKFRHDFLLEELEELYENMKDPEFPNETESNPEEIVDALIDISVVAISTLRAYNVDAYKAWDEVLRANMSKEPGIKATRPNPLNLPDMIKPEGWEGPSHEGNYGRLAELID